MRLLVEIRHGVTGFEGSGLRDIRLRGIGRWSAGAILVLAVPTIVIGG